MGSTSILSLLRHQLSMLMQNRMYLLFRGFLVIVGGFLVHLSLGTIYTFGNIAPYIVSYIRNESHPSTLSQGTTTWIFAFALIGQGGAMFLGGWLVRRIGPRWTTLIGGWVMSLGVFLTYFTIQVSFWLVLLTYGLLFGVGVGMAYIGPLSTAMKWLPKWKGFANGIVVAGFGLGALIFNEVQTKFVNPKNYRTTHGPDGEDYFTQSDLLSRIPYLFLILGGSYATMQLVGSLLITNPPDGYDVVDEDDESRSRTQSSATGTYHEVDDNHIFSATKPAKMKSSINARRKASLISSATTESTVGPRFNKHTTTSASEASPASGETDDERVELMKGNGSPLYSAASSREGSPGPGTNNDDPESSISSTVSWSNNVLTSLRPLQLLKKPNFYMLWFMFMFNGLAVLLTATLYKFFGLNAVDNDDHFMATIGAVSSIFNCAGRIVWGTLADKVSYKFALVLLSGVKTIFLLVTYACTDGGKVLFFVFMCVIFFCIGGNFSVFPTAIARAFGIQYVSVNYGLLFTSQVVAGTLGATLSTVLKKHVGYAGLFFLISGFSGMGFILSLLYRPKRYISLAPNYANK